MVFYLRLVVLRGPNVLTRGRSCHSALHVGAGRAGDAPPDRQFGRARHLRVRAAQHADARRAQAAAAARPQRGGRSAGP